jgi:hypothetical protein
MKPLFLILLTLLFFSCNTLKIASDKNTSNVTSIGIQTNYTKRANNTFKDTIESSIEKVITQFNNEKHAFSVHKKETSDRSYLTLDFSKVRIVSNGGVAAGYIISGIGLIASPILVFEWSGESAILAFWYFPVNRIEYISSLSPYLNAEKGPKQANLIQSGAMFRNKSKRIEVTKTKFEAYFYNSLLNLEKQLKTH